MAASRSIAGMIIHVRSRGDFLIAFYVRPGKQVDLEPQVLQIRSHNHFKNAVES